MTLTNPCSSRLRRSGLSRAIIGATAVGSTGATLLTANAEIVYSGPRNLSTSSLLGIPFAEDVEPVNLDGAGGDEFSLRSFNTKGSDFHHLYDEGRFANFTPIGGNEVRRLDAGETIGSEGIFVDGSPLAVPFIENTPNSQWMAGTEGYFGYRFNPSGEQDLYGWGHVTISPDATILTLVDWAYENSGAPIQAGVPEPCTSLLLMASLIVAALWRRR